MREALGKYVESIDNIISLQEREQDGEEITDEEQEAAVGKMIIAASELAKYQ